MALTAGTRLGHYESPPSLAKGAWARSELSLRGTGNDGDPLMSGPEREVASAGSPPAVIHVPHASTIIPTEVRHQFVLSDAELSAEGRLMTDHLTDELFAMPSKMATTIRFPVSRLVVDPERFESDSRERMTAHGMGGVYERTAGQRPLRRALSAEERGQLIERWYRPHHAALPAAVSTALTTRGVCLVIDAHSFPSVVLPYEEDQRSDRPDICIGTALVHPFVLQTRRSSCGHRPRAGAESKSGVV